MFGVLVVRAPDGRMGWLGAYSGFLADRRTPSGFVPCVFDEKARRAVEEPADGALRRLAKRARAHEASGEWERLRAQWEAVERRQREEAEALRLEHGRRRKERHLRRTNATAVEQEALEQQSRGDKAEKRRVLARHANERAALERTLRRFERRARAFERLSGCVSRSLMKRIHDTYVLRNASGKRSPMRGLFTDGEPPSGAGDCAAPKLLQAAYEQGLTPLALGEFWRGAAPAGGGRLDGEFYAACAFKCGPILPFMLEGLEVAKEASSASSASEPRVVYEDEALVVVDKPAGLLSVPGKRKRANVRDWASVRHPGATGPLLVHRLDEDTSGLLVIALDAASFVALQKQFEAREVEKRYVAWVEGNVVGETGRVSLPVRVDPENRPRQLVDFVHGKAADTDWVVERREAGRTRLHLFPLTGRTHQLRVHASHPRGLGAPIVGDRLYGRRDKRLLLHAEWIRFRHPLTGEWVEFESSAPF